MKLAETTSLSNNQLPTTPEEFERRLLSEPNNSTLWMQYVTYYIQVIDIESARSVLEKGLKVINFREEEVSCFSVYYRFKSLCLYIICRKGTIYGLLI